MSRLDTKLAIMLFEKFKNISKNQYTIISLHRIIPKNNGTFL